MRIYSILFAIAVGIATTLAQAGDTLRVLAWPGYADPDIVAAFEKKTGAQVEVTFIDTDDALWEKASAHGGWDFDVVALNTAELQRYIDAHLVKPISPASIPNIDQQLSRFRHANGIERNGTRYAVPFTYSEMGLIYNKKFIRKPPSGMAALWDEHFRGQIALYEGSNHNFSLTALQMGIADPFHLSSQAFRDVVSRLVALRANRPYFYSSPEDAVALFRSHNIALMFGNYGSQQIRLLKEAGFDVGYVIPKEGALAWLDCWAIMHGSSNPTLAQSWINYMLTPEVGRALTHRQGLANTLEPWPEIRDKDRIIWLQPVEDNLLRNQFWTRVMSGAKKGML